MRFSVLQDLRVICCIYYQDASTADYSFHITMTRPGGVEVAGWTVDRESTFDPRRTPTSRAPSNGNEVKDVFGRPTGVHVMVGMTRKILAAQGAGTWQ